MKKNHVVSLLKEVADIKFCIVSNCKEGKNSERLDWLTASNLLADNVVCGTLESEKYLKDDLLLIRKGDIILKRIQPSFINYIDVDLPNTYAYNNLIVVRAKNIDAKYLAAVLSCEIKEVSLSRSVGAVMSSIGRNDLDYFTIPVFPIEEQIQIGQIWHKSIEKKKMAIKLAELENLKENYMINKYIKNEIGGKNNDNF